MNKTVAHLAFFAGLGCLVYGCHRIYEPLGWLVGGTLLVGFAFVIDREHKVQ